MNIVVILQNYLAQGQPGHSRFNELARLWTEAGHQVTLVAGNLNYMTGEIPEQYRGKWVTREHDGKITLLRCYVPPAYIRSYLGRMWAFLGFTLSASTAAFMIKKPEMIIATSPPLITIFPGWVAARWRWKHIPLIFEIRDLWPESAITTGVIRKDSVLAKMLYAVERWACRTATCINVLTPAFEEDLVHRKLASKEKIVFIPNGADVQAFCPGPRDNAVRREFGWQDRLVVMYAGAHGRANALMQLVETAEYLKNRPDVLIALVGDGPERSALEAETKRRNLINLVFCGPQPKERMPDFINACDIGAAVLQNNPTFRTVYPNKVFDYMACERPVLLAIDGVARQLVCEEAQAGVYVEPEHPQSIAQGICQLMDSPELRLHLGQNGRRWVLANATRESLAEKYLDVMKKLVD